MLDLQKYIDNPTLLNEDTVQLLRNAIDRYPYYQTARILYLINLHQLNHPTFPTELRNAMIFIYDRKNLFQIVEGKRYELLGYMTAAESMEPAVEQPSIVNLTNDYTSYIENLDDIVLDVDETTGENIVPQLKDIKLIDAFLEYDKGKK